MLEDAIAELKDGPGANVDDWTPNIQIGTSVLIPEQYVNDLQLRLSLYRRASLLSSRDEIDEFKAELHDRFGPVPDEVIHLLEIMHIKTLSKQAGIESIEAGPRGAQVGFYQNKFANPSGLIDFAALNSARVKLQADHKLIYKAKWDEASERLQGVVDMVEALHKVALAGDVAEPVS
jgi:transcription-repair coupling factor (superfamily II helicase)